MAEWNTVPSEHFKSSSGSLFVSTTSSWKVAVNFATKKVAGQSQFTPSESQFGLVLVLAPREGEALTSHMNFKEREVAVPVKIDPDQVIGAYPLVKLESGETRVLSFVSNPRSSFSNSLVTQGPKADPQRLDRQAATERLIRDQSDDGVVAIYAKPYETVNTQLQRDIEIAKSATENMIETFTVNRYHHALAHGLRQGALAKDIANVMEQTNTPLGKWVKAQKRQDPFFLDKLEMVATYQRTGRRSESTRDTDEFYEDLHRSAQNFVIAARKPTPPNKTSMFRSNEEIAEYASAIVWQHVPKSFVRQKSSILDLPKIANSIDNFTENEEFIFQIVNAAHGLDGRRITNFNPIRTRREFSDFLDLSFDSVPVEILWQREAAYLKATGDTDRGVAPVRYRHDNEFFLQAKDPQRMVDAIYTVSKNLPRLVIGS